MIYLSKNIEDTKQVAESIWSRIQGIKSANKALLIGLCGDLGSGKTTFTQALGELLGIKETMTSPTFVIMKKYPILNLRYSEIYNYLIHIDAYRLENSSELASLDFADLLLDPKNLILLEWPERVAEALPADMIKINFKFIGEFEREIDF